MSITEHSLREFNDNTIVFHFDVAAHSVPVRQFVDTANATLSVIDCFNEELFEGKVRYELRVITPAPGGLIEILELVIAVGLPIWGFLATDIGKAYLKGLTGHEPAYWAERSGEKTRKLIRRRSRDVGPPDDSIGFMVSSPFVEVTHEDEKKELEAAILAELIVRFMETNTDQLEKIGVTKKKFRKAYAAKNKVYQGCIENREVKGLGFDQTDDFPLSRDDFPRFITSLPEEQNIEPDETPTWRVEEVDILANSPNWERDGRKWQGRTHDIKDIAFVIEDEEFWQHVKTKDISPEFGDNMKVQWAYPVSSAKPSNVRVLKVLSFNGREIADAMTEGELQKILEEVSINEPDAPSLFDQMTGEKKESEHVVVRRGDDG